MTPEEQRTLDLFELVEDRPDINQRELSSELGISLGLANAFLRKVLSKGWVRARQVKARRWLYFLTPQGALEKSRLSLNYLQRTLDSFRQLRRKADLLLGELAADGVTGVHLIGDSDLSDIISLCLEGWDIECISVSETDMFLNSSQQKTNHFPELSGNQRILINSIEHRTALEKALQRHSLQQGRHWLVFE